MVRLAVVGLGKMGLSHFSMINAHPEVKVVAICDAMGYVLDVLNKYAGTPIYTDYNAMLNEVELDAVIIATPSLLHGKMVRSALEKGIHVFCEKPFCLDVAEGGELTRLARQKGLVNQVGYHYRFVGAFQEMKRLLDLKAIGEVTHVLAEAYGPVVLKPKGSSWRSQSSQGGGCLYDYAAHPINLLNWFLGAPIGVGGTVVHKIHSKNTDDKVFGTLFFENEVTAQVSVNWSDESCRKMSTKMTVWGSQGRIFADRQECQAYLREPVAALPDYSSGWNVRYTTDLTKEVWFYLRGEEYSAQLDYFVGCIKNQAVDNLNSFESAWMTDQVISMMIEDAKLGPSVKIGNHALAAPKKNNRFFTFFTR